MKILPVEGLSKDKKILEVNKQVPRITLTISNFYRGLVEGVEDYKG